MDPASARAPKVGAMSVNPQIAADRSRLEAVPDPEPEPRDVSEHDGQAWPEPLAATAYTGPAGEIIETLAPLTEASREAMLLQLFSIFGVNAGSGRYCHMGGSAHPPRLWVVLIGETSKARKGTALARVRALFGPLEGAARIAEGLSTGEGLIDQVRDPVERTNKDGEREIVDAGITDKRLAITEGEFARVLKVMSREGNTLSPVLRTAWDSGDLDSLIKNSRIRATGAHVGVIGHITTPELQRYLTETEMANGLGNRFLWIAVRRSGALPFDGELDPGELVRLQGKLAEALAWVSENPGRVEFDDEARELWIHVYGELSEGRPGLAGALLARSETQAVRLALAYSLLARSPAITAAHLRAALAITNFVEATVRYTFGDTLGDPVADEIVRQLRNAGQLGLTRTEISGALRRHVKAAQISRTLAEFEKRGKATCERESSEGGRPTERWTWRLQ